MINESIINNIGPASIFSPPFERFYYFIFAIILDACDFAAMNSTSDSCPQLYFRFAVSEPSTLGDPEAIITIRQAQPRIWF